MRNIHLLVLMTGISVTTAAIADKLGYDLPFFPPKTVKVSEKTEVVAKKPIEITKNLGLNGFELVDIKDIKDDVVENSAKPVIASATAIDKVENTDFMLKSSDLDTIPDPSSDRPSLDNITARPPQPRPIIDLNDPAAERTETVYDPKTGTYQNVTRIGNTTVAGSTPMTIAEFLKQKAEQQKRDYFKQLSQKITAATGGGLFDPTNKIDVKNQIINQLFGEGGVSIKPQGNIDITFGGDHQYAQNPNLTQRQQNTGGFNFDMGIQLNVVGTIGSKLKLTANYNTKSTFDFENQVKLSYGGADVSQLAGAAAGAAAGIAAAGSDPSKIASAAGIPTSASGGDTDNQIFQHIEAGTVGLPLRSSLIQGSQTLFGIKTRWKFGHLMVTNVISQQKSKRQELQIQGGSQLQTFSIEADRYDENRHFFVSHYNRNTYESALKTLPQVNSLFRITKMELWVTNTRNATEGGVRDIVALTDLGEPDTTDFANKTVVRNTGAGVRTSRDLAHRPLPKDSANNLKSMLSGDPNSRFIDQIVSKLQMDGLQQVRDFEKVRARKLATSEYTFNPELGYVSLNTTLQPTDVLGVAYEYTYNGRAFRVGEFAGDVANNLDTTRSNVLFVKLLKSTTSNYLSPLWDLMMKNIYSLGAYQINPQDFKLDIFYNDPSGNGKKSGGKKRFIPAGDIDGVPLIRALNLDNLNSVRDPIPDGVFDFVPGVTINPANGRIIFPVLEPFGSSLRAKINDATVADRYVYQQLYDLTVTRARQFPEFNRFTLEGSYKSASSSDISLGAFNIPKGSVKVSAGGQQLREGIDYDVDYNIGRIKILNEAYLNSGQAIKVSFEDNTLFGFQVRNMIGTHFDYQVSDNFTIGATHLRLDERPFTQKVNLGDDPIDNNVLGLDFNYSKDAPWLTKALDALPLYSTKAPSKITFTGEVAHLIPGHAQIINQKDENGVSDAGGAIYIDDFEGSVSNYDLRIPSTSWNICATPRDDPNNVLPEHPKFPEATLVDNLDYGKNRARMSWYRLDPQRYLGGGDKTPYAALVYEKDIFPQLDPSIQTLNNNYSFDIGYYPKERGPYNYDALPVPNISAGCDVSGALNNPKSRWGGIMRPLQNADFEAANIEFIEMWVMSPFHSNGGNAKGGDVYFNLGNVSEDVLRDSRMYFENGIPAPGSNNRIDNTNWGRVPRVQPIVNAFDNDPNVRSAQDIGFDGLDDDAEKAKFDDVFLKKMQQIGTGAFNSVKNDPSSDNFVFYNDTTGVNSTSTKIRDRYKRHNNPQGNSPTNVGNTVSQSGTNIPDSEDLNRDNTLSETEAYYEYKLHLEPDMTASLDDRDAGAIAPSRYIVDKVKASIVVDPVGPVRQNVYFYQVKIPVDQYTSKIGEINDFRSVRYMRMYMTNWEDEVTLRMARLQLVRNQWRRYTRDLIDPFVGTPCTDADATVFDVVSVNYEQNSNRKPYPYLIPPGIRRELSVNPTQQTQQNEQALQLSVCNLCDGSAKGIFKNLNLDMRTFKRLRMFVHAERREEDPNLQDNQMSVFMRIGSDYENNYYEYEIPLKLTTGTAPTSLTPGSPEETDYKKQIWLSQNSFDFTFDLLRSLKIKRNNDNTSSPNIPYTIEDPAFPGHKVRIKGNPDLGYAKGVMIGVRNPTDDAAPHCATVWVNELRASGFDETGGTAALARLDVTLADLGNVTASGSYSSIGWGNLEQRVAQRSKEENLQYDVAGTLELGKFLPKTWGIRLPFFAQYANQIKTPQFDPYQLDIPFKDVISAATSQQQRDSLREQAITINSVRGFNFTNVRKDRTATKTAPMPWDIENFSLTYAYNQIYKSDPTVARNILDQYRGALDYSYAIPQPLDIRPFKFIKNDLKGWLSIIKDFNFNPLPNSFTFSNQMNRQVGQIKYRFSGDDVRATWFDKRFTWDRSYNLQWNLTKSIGLTFSATNNAVVDEPRGLLDTPAKEEQVWRNIQKFGRNRAYNHSLAINYSVPINKIPLLDWVQVKASYNATYNWSRSSLNADSLGNVLGNTQNRQINADLDFTRFYNKWGYLKKINSAIPEKAKKTGKEDGKTDPKTGAKGGKDGAKDMAKGGGKEEDPEEDVNIKDTKSEKEGKVERTKKAEKKLVEAAPANGAGAKTGKKEPKPHEPTMAERIILRPLMMIRKGRATYQEQFGTTIPGFLPQTRLLGMSNDWQSPGFDFVAGAQPNSRWLDAAAQKGWMTENPYLNQQVQQTYTQTANAQLNLEPFDDFRIDVTASRTYTKNHSELFKRDSLGAPNHSHLTPMDMGSLTVSFFTLNTLFIDKTGADYSKMFKDFEANRIIVSKRLGSDTHTAPIDAGQGYTFGYGRYSQATLIPSFLAAYTGQDANTYALNVFNTIPLPNWKLTYNGLNKFKSIGKIFSSISITHGYKSTLTVNSFRSNLFQKVDADGFFSGNIDPISRNFYSIYEIPDMIISEQLQPLIGIDVRTKKDLTARVEFKKSRNLTMNFTDYQVNETRTDEFVIGAGYRVKGLKLPFTIGPKKPIKKEEDDKTAVIGPDGKKKPSKKPKAGTILDNDMNFKLDVSYRDDITFNRPLDQDPVRTRGLRTLRASPSVDYQLNKNLNIRVFYDYNSTVPATSASFPITTQQGGVTIRFTLGK